MDALARIKEKGARAPKGDAPYLLNKGAREKKYAEHKGCLNPVLSEEEVVAFERQHRITLPKEYRTFLLEVGNGGLGPGYGLSTLAEAAEESPTRDLDKPFPFSFRLYQEDRARWREESRGLSAKEVIALSKERRKAGPPPEMEYVQPGVLSLANPDPPWASVYLVITGEDRGMVWMYGHLNCGWNPEAPTSRANALQCPQNISP
jgi:hypothetical protein